MNKISERHHYIPKFYIKGFLNSSGKLYVYDKVKDEIKKNTFSPKQIFFEWNRNNVSSKNYETNILEDFYSLLDFKSAKTIQKLRDQPNKEGLLTDDIFGSLRFFILNLFWRIPKNDVANFIYYYKSTKNSKMDDKFKFDPRVIKCVTASFPFEITKNFPDQKRGKIKYQLFEFEKDTFLIGDYPILFKKKPSIVDELIYEDYILPISSKRIYRSTEENMSLSFSQIDIASFNALIIDQSEHYICGPDKVQLEQSIENWKFVKFIGQLPYLSQKLFQN